jgi:cell division protein FtsL
MNAAARLVHRSALQRYLIFSFFLKPKQMLVSFLSMAILLSAMAIIYNTHDTRLLHADLQRLNVEQTALRAAQSQLLLEQSTLVRQERLQMVAKNELGMDLPHKPSLIVIRE